MQNLGVAIGLRLAKAIQAMEDPRPLPIPIRRMWAQYHAPEGDLVWAGGLILIRMPRRGVSLRHLRDLQDWDVMLRRQEKKYVRSVKVLKAAGFGFLVVPR